MADRLQNELQKLVDEYGFDEVRDKLDDMEEWNDAGDGNGDDDEETA